MKFTYGDEVRILPKYAEKIGEPEIGGYHCYIEDMEPKVEGSEQAYLISRTTKRYKTEQFVIDESGLENV